MAFTEEEKKVRHREADRRWRERNPELAKTVDSNKAKKYYASHSDVCRGRAAESKIKNPEYMRNWWKTNKEKQREYRTSRKEQRAQYTKNWRRMHPGETKAHKHNRRAKEAGAGGTFTANEWFTLCFAVGFKCLKCGKIKKLTPDHVVPVSLGGTGWLYNIQPLCSSCNSSKHAHTVDYREKINVVTNY